MKTGIVTAANNAYFPGLRLLVESLQGSAFPVQCVDLGLTDSQREWCINAAISLLPYAPDVPHDDSIHELELPIWQKPLFIAQSVFDRVIWLDSDVIVLGDINRLATLADTGPIFTPDFFGGTGSCNSSSLYETFEVPAGAPVDSLHLNAGVLVVERARDGKLIHDWIGLVHQALCDGNIRRLVRCYDQGALLWSVLRNAHHDRVLADARWNAPANVRTSDPSSAILRTSYRNDSNLMREIRRDHPGAEIVHWMGSPKLWDIWSQ